MPLVAPALIGTSPFYVLLFYWGFRRLPRRALRGVSSRGPPTTHRLVAYRDATHPPDDGRRRLLAAVFTWSNFLDPLIYLFEEDKFTSPLGLKALARLVRPDFPLLLAGAVAATAPVVAAFLYVQRYFASRRASSRR